MLNGFSKVFPIIPVGIAPKDMKRAATKQHDVLAKDSAKYVKKMEEDSAGRDATFQNPEEEEILRQLESKDTQLRAQMQMHRSTQHTEQNDGSISAIDAIVYSGSRNIQQQDQDEDTEKNESEETAEQTNIKRRDAEIAKLAYRGKNDVNSMSRDITV